MNRGVLRSKIFSTEQDDDAFVSILSEMQLRIPIRILAWCLMPNHWHLVLWPKTEKEISEYLRLVTGTHVQRWRANHETRGTGALYQGRFKACAVEGNEYLLTVLRYVERNPLRANLVDSADQRYWSSMRTRLGTPAADRLIIRE